MDTTLPDLASRALGGNVPAANDELFAQRENLIRPEAPTFDPSEFGHKGKVYDGWETRRRRDAGHDWAIVALGAAGVIDHVVVDTAFFRGNYPPHISGRRGGAGRAGPLVEPAARGAPGPAPTPEPTPGVGPGARRRAQPVLR